MRRVVVRPALFEPLIFQPLMSTGEVPGLYNSMNSSLPPFGPRVRNSLMSTAATGATLVGVLVGVLEAVKVGVTVGVLLGVGVSVLVGVLVGVSVGCVPVVGVSVLEALASGVDDEKVIAVVPIGRSDLAWQAFAADTNGAKRSMTEPSLDPSSALSESLNDHPGLPIVAPNHCLELLREATGESRNLIEIRSSLASAIARLAAQHGRDLSVPKPIYMRSAVAR